MPGLPRRIAAPIDGSPARFITSPLQPLPLTALPKALEVYNCPMTFRVVIEFDPEADAYAAVCPELPGCASAGFTESEARVNIEEAIRLYLTPFPIDLPDRAKLFEVQVG